MFVLNTAKEAFTLTTGLLAKGDLSTLYSDFSRIIPQPGVGPTVAEPPWVRTRLKRNKHIKARLVPTR